MKQMPVIFETNASGKERKNMDFSEIALVPLITGLVHTVKLVGIQKRFLPICAIVFGISISLLFTAGDWKEDMMIGTWLGLSSVGFYSGSKTS